MQTPTRTGPHGPPHVPLRHGQWPVMRTPRWLFAAGALVLAGAVLVGLVHHPTPSQRAADMNAFLHDMTTDIQSCAGGVREAFTVLHTIDSRASHDLATAISEARYGAANCSPANNELLGDLTQYQVSESLASYHLDRVVQGLVTWAFPDAMHVQSDVADVLGAHGTARAAATAKLRLDLQRLDGQRAYVDKIMMATVTGTSATGKLPVLPG
jgi:hypothetical protein